MTNKITIENIKGVAHTVVSLSNFYNNYEIGLEDENNILHYCGKYYVLLDLINNDISHVVLPPLPRNLSAAYHKLYCAYEMHGLTIVGTYPNLEGYPTCNIRGHFDTLVENERFITTHAINEVGECVEIAIRD